MKYILFIPALLLLPSLIYAAEITFSVVPSGIPGDGAVTIEAFLKPDADDPPLNAVEGRIGLLGEGSQEVIDIVIETGDSVLSLWPEPPRFSAEEHIIRFTGGAPEALSNGGKMLRLRLFTKSDDPITISWLGGAAYAADGSGTPVGITSRSLVIAPKAGLPNLISPTSDDIKPPIIESVIVTQDPDVFGGDLFLSVQATDNETGISHFEIIEKGEMMRLESGPYVLKDQNQSEPLLLIAYDKAGNSVSVRVPADEPFRHYGVSMFLIILVVFMMIVLSRLVKGHKK